MLTLFAGHGIHTSRPFEMVTLYILIEHGTARGQMILSAIIIILEYTKGISIGLLLNANDELNCDNDYLVQSSR